MGLTNSFAFCSSISSRNRPHTCGKNLPAQKSALPSSYHLPVAPLLLLLLRPLLLLNCLMVLIACVLVIYLPVVAAGVNCSRQIVFSVVGQVLVLIIRCYHYWRSVCCCEHHFVSF